MQRLTRRFWIVRVPAQLAVLLLAGCLGDSSGPDTTAPKKPLEGTALAFRCSDDRLRGLLEPAVRVWSRETGATVSVGREPMKPGDAVDVAIIPAAELGAWADRGDLLPVPFSLREPGHTYQWSSITAGFRSESAIGWGSQLLALPVAAETPVLVYRADRIATPATTWEALADLLAARKGPGLAALTPVQLEDLFYRVAACYDRPAGSGQDGERGTALPFTFDLTTGRCRLETKGFVEAGRWIANLKARGILTVAEKTDPAEDLNASRAAVAILSLAEVAKLNKDSRYILAPLPGTKSFVNPKTGNLAPVPSNSVPFLDGGWVAVVRKSGKNPDAAFALLAELTGPARSRELVASGGFAPVRDSQLEPDRLIAWLGYGFDEAGTRSLQDAIRANLGIAARDPAHGLRSPDEADLRRALREELLRVANGSASPEAALKAAAEKWDRTPHLDWRRRAAGLN